MSKSKVKLKEEDKLTKKTTKHVLVGGKQLEAQVHTSLPPLVKGALRGHVRVSLEGGIVWEYSIGPPAPKLCVRLKWWGEKSPGTFFRVPVKMSSSHARDSTTLAYFPVTAGLPQLTAYFKDMGNLICDIGLGRLTDDSMLIGQTIVPNLMKLTPKSSIKGLFPIVTSNDVHLGHLHVHVSIEMTKQTPHGSGTGVVAPPSLTKTAHNENEEEDQPLEFIVGPGTRWKTQQPTSVSSSPQRGRLFEPVVGTLTKKPSHETTTQHHHQQQQDDDTTHSERRVSGPMVTMGTQQMGVISELIERGQRLRDEMVHSVANVYDSTRPRDDGTSGRLRSTGGDSLTLLSAELAHRGGSHDLDVDHVYVDVSSSEGEGLDEGGVSTCDSDYEDTLLSAILLSEQPHPQTHSQDDKKSFEDNKTHLSSDNPSQTSSKPLRTETEDHHGDTPLLPTTNHDHVSSPPRSHRVGMNTDSMTSKLSSHFSGRSLEGTIISSIGMERLTCLGRVTVARVCVDVLEVDTAVVDEVVRSSRRRKKKQSSRVGQRMVQPQVGPATSATYFVEYQFPALVGGRCGRGHHHEVMRIASKKMSHGVVSFSHSSVFPVVFDGSVLQQWWNNILVFRVYCRPSNERLPVLVGKAVVPLRKWLTSSSLSTQCQVEVKTATITDAVSGLAGDDPSIGTLSLSLALLEGKKQHPIHSSKIMADPLNKRQQEVIGDMKHSDGTADVTAEHNIQSGPVHFKEEVLKSKDISQKKTPPSLQLLLLVPEATDVKLPRNSSFSDNGVPNCYFICKLFCANPHPSTPVQWATTNPQFAFKQIHYLYLTPSLMEKLCNNFTVIEVWHKTPGTNTEDDLVGLVKLSLHQFYLAYSDEQSMELFHQAELPVIAVDSYCPIVNPFTGASSGHLAVLLALGTDKQVCHLQQQVASGSYSLHRPHHQPPPPTRGVGGLVAATGPPGNVGDEHHVSHVFELTVEGVRGLAVFDNTVWGEADCFVQYHFPTSVSCSDNDIPSEISLSPYRTGTILCVPNPSFSHKTQHTLLLPVDVPLQRELIAACGGSVMSGGIPFELWRRFYYPNIRDQLVARTSLPLAKLCAMVSMQKRNNTTKSTGISVQCFPLQMKLVSDSSQQMSGGSSSTSGGGVLDLTVEYRALSSSVCDDSPQLEQSYVTLSVGVLRATGLKDAAELAVKDHPVPLGLASEVGVNSYITLSIPDIVKDKRTSKTVARSFAPEFSHFFDLTLPLSLPPAGGRSKQPATRVPLAQCLAESAIVIEVWHKLSRRSSSGEAVGHLSSNAVFGRKLAPTINDVLLGYTEIPLIQLLQKHTGVRGWFPLHPPLDSSLVVPHTEDQSSLPHCRYTGGVELSVSFSKEADQQTVFSSAFNDGWKPPPSCLATGMISTNQTMCSFANKHVKFELKVDFLWMPVIRVVVSTASQPTHQHCFVRYRFFDKKATVSSPKAVTFVRDGRACYQLQHRSRVSTPGSAQLQWYLKEESLEVQLWATLSTGKKMKTSSRPQAKDTLLGSAFIPLSALLRITENNVTSISGCYPLFKAGLDSLGNQAIQMSISSEITEGGSITGESTATNTSMEILDSEDESELTSTKDELSHSKWTDKKDAGSDELQKDTTPDKERSYEDMFPARVMIHQALHLPSIRCSSSLEECPPSAYVTLHPHPAVEKISTAVVSESHRPSWEHQCTTHIPNLYLQSHSPGLEIQVWSKQAKSGSAPPTRSSISNGGPPSVTRSEREDMDVFIGCVNVDLSPLSYGLSQICGWYNITDFSGQSQGQLKVSVVPTQRISFPSPMLSTPLPLLASIIGKTTVEVPKSSTLHHHNREGNPPEPTSRTSSMLFEQLRENIKDLDAVHESLLTRLRETEHQSLRWTSHNSHDVPEERVTEAKKPLTSTYTTLQVGDPELASATPPSSLSHAPNQHIGTQEIVPNQQKQQHGVTSVHVADSPSPVPSEENLSTLSSSRNESSTSESDDKSSIIKSSSAGQLQTDHKESSGVDEGQDDDPLGRNQTTSITDVSVCSELSEEIHSPLSHHDSAEIDSTAQLSAVDTEQHDSSSEQQQHVVLPSQPEEHCTQQEPTTEMHQPSFNLQTNTGEASSDHVHTHSPGSTPNKSPELLSTNIDPSKSSHQPATTLHRHHPVVHLPDPHLPNFFMPPHELEQSMRQLHSSALSRPPPRRLPPQKERTVEHKETSSSHTISDLQTLHDVKEFLQSRRKTVAKSPPAHDGSRGGENQFTAETKRIATIFSS